LPFATHTDWPLAHDVDPVWQTLPPGLQEAPDVHATHCPPLQTLLTSHAVPAAALLPVSVQTTAPPTHETVPWWHGWVDGTHCAPLVHVLQVPPLQ
jgi:hypothetical protein